MFGDEHAVACTEVHAAACTEVHAMACTEVEIQCCAHVCARLLPTLREGTSLAAGV